MKQMHCVRFPHSRYQENTEPKTSCQKGSYSRHSLFIAVLRICNKYAMLQHFSLKVTFASTSFYSSIKIIHLFSSQCHVSMDHKLPYIIQGAEAKHAEHMTFSQHHRVPLLQGMGSPLHRPCLSTLLEEELQHINALHLCRSPARGSRGCSPSQQPFFNEELSPSSLPSPNSDRPTKLLMPCGSCVSPLNLSPR